MWEANGIELPEEGGSWWKSLAFRTKKAATHKEVTERLEKAERALELQCLDKPQAEANHSQAEAAAALIGSLKDTKNACIQVGSLLLVKMTSADGESSIVARTLSINELRRIEENQAMLRRPDEILDWLAGKATKKITP